MFLKHLRETEKKTKRVHWAEEQLEQAREAASEPPSEMIVACAAYLYLCASSSFHPTYRGALKEGFRVHAAALDSALTDAVSMGWIGQSEDGTAFWKEAGKPDSCPLVVLSKLHPRWK